MRNRGDWRTEEVGGYLQDISPFSISHLSSSRSSKSCCNPLDLGHLEGVRLALSFVTTLLVLCTTGLPAQAAHTRVTLVLASETARPGDTVMAGLRLQMDPGWHTYWQNPGASGMPTTIDWQLPPGLSAGKAEWPLPEKLFDPDLTTYIYQDEVVVLFPLKVAANVKAGPEQIEAKVSWLECAVQCLPGQGNVEATLTIASEPKPSSEAALLAQWEKKLPKQGADLNAKVWWEKPPAGEVRPLILEWDSKANREAADFYPDANDDFEVQGQVEQVPSVAGKIAIRKQVKKLSGDWPKRLSGLLVEGTPSARTAYQVSLEVQSGRNLSAMASAPSNPVVPGPATAGLWKNLIYAFIGGLILNIMPCVLPVIALKILGFVGQAKDHPRRARMLGLVYAAGVLVSFLVLAGLVLGIKAAGHQAGWGFQFSSPYFLVAMTTLVTLIALNLFGVFEVQLGGRTMDAAAGLSSRHGVAGAFFNGLLATVLATSCTAPFLGAAVGFAFAPSQTAATTIAVFLCVGLGLAFPYVLLAWEPRWLKWLPKPGPWMERFKIAMGFPMLAAAVWLFSLVSVYYGDRTWWLAIFLVMVAVAAWIYGEFIQRHRARPVLATIAILLVLVAGYAYALEGHLKLRDPITQEQAARQNPAEQGGVAWQPWSVAAVAQARAEHRPVLVDFTAKWCLTCNTVVKPALESTSVRQKLQELKAVPLLGDYTRFPDNITEELTRHGRAGVPLVLVYPPEPDKPPIVLPEALTPGIVVNALDRAVE